MTWDYSDTINDLFRIATTPYKAEDSNQNHQTFAKALYLVLVELKKYGITNVNNKT